ncbi:hypothetical protein HPB52_009267 [Rhipicephalus sanguineus]|nr:hypothetical protein HPB52_009267 [Rhipicephalus sanguineus]
MMQDIAANDVHTQAPLTVVEDYEMVRDTSMKVGESSTTTPASVDLAACEAHSDVDKSKPTATPTGTGARPKTGTPRVPTKTRKKKTMQLCDPRGPTPRRLYRMSLHLRPPPARFASCATDSACPEDDFFAAVSQREKDIFKDLDFCSSSEEGSASMQELERNNEEQFKATEANLSECCALEVEEPETGDCAQLSAEMQSSNDELINLKTVHTDVPKSREGLRGNFNSQEQEYGNIPEDVEKDSGSRLDSMKQKRNGQRVGAEKRHVVLPQKYKTTKQQAKHYRHMVHEQRMLRQQLTDNSSFERKKEKLLATLQERHEEMLKFEVAALEVELMERELLRRISRMRKIETILENLKRRVAREDAAMNQMAEQLAMLMGDAEPSREHLRGG